MLILARECIHIYLCFINIVYDYCQVYIKRKLSEGNFPLALRVNSLPTLNAARRGEKK